MPKIKDIIRKPKHITSIGGQALIEGVMMKGPRDIAIAVRKPDGEIELKKDPIDSKISKIGFFKLPFIRGSAMLLDAMVIGTRALMYSAEFFEEEESESEPTKFDNFMDKVFKDNADNVAIYLSVFISLIISMVGFMLGPSLLANLFKSKIESSIALNLIEGSIRILIFIAYVVAISKMKDIYRVFQYHGAEHKSIHCYESGEELTVENARKFTTLHPRCGTSFLVMVMIISILTFSVFGWPNPIMRLALRIVMLPIIAGISYEINKVIGKSDSKIAYWVSYPGLMFQKLTTNEPDDSQLEVGLEALKAVLVEDREADLW